MKSICSCGHWGCFTDRLLWFKCAFVQDFADKLQGIVALLAHTVKLNAVYGEVFCLVVVGLLVICYPSPAARFMLSFWPHAGGLRLQQGSLAEWSYSGEMSQVSFSNELANVLRAVERSFTLITKSACTENYVVVNYLIARWCMEWFHICDDKTLKVQVITERELTHCNLWLSFYLHLMFECPSKLWAVVSLKHFSTMKNDERRVKIF